METKGRQINIMFINNNKYSLGGFRIISGTHIDQCRVSENENIHIINISKYMDLLTNCGPAYEKAFSWLKKPLELLDNIADLSKIEDI